LNEELPTAETAYELGLNQEEYDRIVEQMGRKPNFTELSIYSVMWSEHCCYKNSVVWLKTLPKQGKHIMAEAGEENAGLVDIGDGLACAFKIESHNHPSAIEPYQGASTGVGGIHRDIFTMGARPIAALNSLRFGELKLPNTKRLLKGVVKGIGDYGNSFGVPTVGGEIYFDPSYNVNPLINAMSVGIVNVGETISAVAYGKGNPVYIVGSATGKDGIHGASFASADITDESEEDLPAVQVGDPFQEKLLLEATIEAINSGVVVGMQDMGAAGICCSTSEMSAKGEAGMNIFLDQVPLRQQNMNASEILLSESQERMLLVVEKGKEADIEAIFDKWDLNCAIIGEVTEQQSGLQYYMNDELVAHLPADSLVLGGGAPVYEREVKTPAYLDQINAFHLQQIKVPSSLKAEAFQLLENPNVASKKWVIEQYDSMVQTNTMTTNQPSDAAVIRLKGTNKAMAMVTDCNASYIYADPYKGGQIAVAEAARNIVCSGGEPSAISNCLNFGNPLNPEVYWQFVRTVQGMGDACEKLDTPVTGGNVSFYNHSPNGGPVLPTPVIGMIGLLNDRNNHMTLDFKAERDLIYLVGTPKEDLGSSQYLRFQKDLQHSPAPFFDLEQEYQLHENIKSLIEHKLIQSAHDVSDGGLWVTLVESGMAGAKGFEIQTASDMRKDAYLFGEAQSRIVVSVKPDQQHAFESQLTNKGQDFTQLGKVTNGHVTVDGEHWAYMNELYDVYDYALEDLLSE